MGLDVPVQLLHGIALLIVLCAASVAGEYCSGYYDNRNIYHSGFSCPRWLDSYKERYCCGSYSNKYCCSQSYYYDGYKNSPVGVVLGAILTLTFLLLIIVLPICCLCQQCPLYQRRHRGRVLNYNGAMMMQTNPRATVTSYSTSGAIMTGSCPPGVHRGAWGACPGPGGPIYTTAPLAAPPPYMPAYPPPAYTAQTTTTTTTTVM